jgi:preprotein translocase subunit SecE
MSLGSELKAPRFDTLKWLLVIAIVIIGISGNYWYSDQSLLYRAVALVFLAILALLIAFQTARGKAFYVMFSEARNEIRKVVWPNRQETTQTTLIVVVVVFIMSLLLWGLDSLLSWGVSSFIG